MSRSAWATPGVDGGRVKPPEYPTGDQCVFVGHQTRLGRISLDQPIKGSVRQGEAIDGKRVWQSDDDTVEGIVLLRKDAQSLPALRDVEDKVEQLNQPSSSTTSPPGVKLETALRSHGPDERHSGNGQREPDVRHDSGQRRDSADVSQQYPHGNYRRDQAIPAAMLPFSVLYLCAASRPTCCRSGPSISESSSICR